MLQNLKSLLANPSGSGETEKYAELELPDEGKSKVGVVVERMESFTDSDRIIRSLREGKVVFAKIGQFKSTNLDELKRTLSKIKTVCRAIDGEVVAVGQQEWLIIAPPNCQIVR